MSDEPLPLHAESTALVHAPVDRVFDFLDDPMALSSHMRKPSAMMMGARMAVEVDSGGGRVVHSKIRMHAHLLGMALSLEEVVTERQAPHKKVWETMGTPRLLVIAHYRMGFELTPQGEASLLRVFIDYRLPSAAPGSWLGRWLGAYYARWCIQRMAGDAARHFNSTLPKDRRMSASAK
ncbi:MAG: SRPBCC family protein [Rhodoferax sp.]|nr:SRPBCC family protein [Rhodoferax sp.]MDP3651790.1 SRPBCC family protein [Rhodoferax sp.]